MDDGVLNVLTMTLGEIEFVDNFIRDPGMADPFKLDVYILLAIFLFLMPIVLINLMVSTSMKIKVLMVTGQIHIYLERSHK